MNLQELALKYGTEQAGEAYNEAVRRRASNPLAYAERILESRFRPKEKAPAAKLLCDACGKPIELAFIGYKARGRDESLRRRIKSVIDFYISPRFEIRDFLARRIKFF